jgi:hypothetical protein
MISVAAVALIAGTGFANAQGTGTSREGAGSTVQQSAPSSGPSSAGSSAGQMNHESTESKSKDATKPSPGMKSTQSEQKSPTAGKNERAEDIQGQKPKGMNSENNAKGAAKDMKAEGREDHNGMKAEGREDSSKMKAEGREGRTGADSKSTAETGRTGADSKSTAETGRTGVDSKSTAETKSQTTTTGRRRREALDRTAHQDHHRDPGSARCAGQQRQLLDLDRHPRAARSVVPPASGGRRDGLSGVARV